MELGESNKNRYPASRRCIITLNDAERKAAWLNAIQHLKEAKSIVIDLRNNGGGDPFAVQLLCSMYLDEGKPLNTIEYRNDESVSKVEFNTLSRQELPEEKRLLKTPLYILTGPWTFSAAEEFTNDLKIHKRATVIGELTGGGANPSRLFQINSVLSVSIPVGKAVNPIEENNWEGVGIIPDYLAPEAEALPKTLEILNELK